MEGTAIVTQIIAILTSGIKGIAQGIGEGLSALVQSVFFVTTVTGETAVTTMSTFGILVCVFSGIGLAIGLSRLVVRWLSSLGGSRM